MRYACEEFPPGVEVHPTQTLVVFSSTLFLVLFLPLFLLAYFACPERWRNVVALVASLFFYAWGAPSFVFVLVLSCWVDFRLGKLIAEAPVDSRKRKILLGLGVTLNVGLLAYFKYTNLAVAEINSLLSALGYSQIAWTEVALPLGISFFVFHHISFLVDVYRRTTGPAKSLANYTLYVSLFPQLIAGPIIRYHDVAAQFEHRVHSLDKFFEGIWRFCIGLGKKVLIANVLGQAADQAFNADPATLPAGAAWIGLVCYSFQIYFDFSGYSDMAIGLARMMGIEFLENFNCPYTSTSFTDFWRRWHISLSNFMREYLYIPLGGNRVGPVRAYANLWIVFLLSGLWHGANWTFVVWGAYHGFFLSLDKLFWQQRCERISKLATVPLTFLLVSLGWVFFRCDTFGGALQYFTRLADFPSIGLATTAGGTFALSHRETCMLVVAALFSFLPASAGSKWFANPTPQSGQSMPLAWAKCCGSLSLLVLSYCALVSQQFNPFIYFRF